MGWGGVGWKEKNINQGKKYKSRGRDRVRDNGVGVGVGSVELVVPIGAMVMFFGERKDETEGIVDS